MEENNLNKVEQKNIKYTDFVKDFFKENKNYILAAFAYVVFCIFLFIITPIEEEHKNLLMQSAKEYIDNIMTDNNFHLFLNIFINNSLIGFMIFVSGFLLSLLSMFIVLSNVFVIWIVMSMAIEKVWLWTSLLAILPHGFIEIFAILLTLALSFKITHLVFKKVWNWKKHKIWWEIKKSIQFFWTFILLLIFIASAIEVFITPLFLG